MFNDLCPYCNYQFEKEVKKKRVCPNCGNTMYVRHGKVVTERETIILHWQAFMEYLVPDIIDIRNKVETKLKESFGKEPSANDVVWGMFNHITIHLREPRQLATNFENMAYFLESEGKPEDAKIMLRESTKMSILDYKENAFVEKVKITNFNDGFVCEECKKHNGKIFTVDEALNDPPVPIMTCENKKCRCRIDFVYKGNIDNYNETIEIKIKPQKGFLQKLFGL